MKRDFPVSSVRGYRGCHGPKIVNEVRGMAWRSFAVRVITNALHVEASAGVCLRVSAVRSPEVYCSNSFLVGAAASIVLSMPPDPKTACPRVARDVQRPLAGRTAAKNRMRFTLDCSSHGKVVPPGAIRWATTTMTCGRSQAASVQNNESSWVQAVEEHFFCPSLCS